MKTSDEKKPVDIETLTREMNDRKEKIDSEIAELETAVEMDNVAIKAAESAMTSASDKSDVDAYHIARCDKEKAEESRDMHTARLNKLSKSPVISESEYKKILDDLRSSMDVETADIDHRVDDVLSQLIPLNDELKSKVTQTKSAMMTAYTLAYPGDHPKKSDGSIASRPNYIGHTATMLRIKSAAGINEYDY